MTSAQDDYHVHIEHHAATPAALADAQRALLHDESVRSRVRRLRRWQRVGMALAWLMMVVGVVAVVVAVRSAGTTTAYENCLAEAEAMASTLDAAQLENEAAAGEDTAEELCADYRR